MTVIVAYASKHGATQGIAERIAATLVTAGVDAQARPIASVGDVRTCEAVVIGSAVYFGSWLKEAAEFVRRHQAVLAERPVWLFSSGPTGNATLPEPQEIAEFQATIHPRGHHIFAGALDRGRLSFPERMIVKGVKAAEGDFRDWGEIGAWAEGIAHELAPAATTANRK